MTKILLIISLSINIILYFGLIDIGQYRNYVKSTIELTKDFAKSDQFQQMKDNTKDLGNQIVENANKEFLEK